MNHSVFFHFLSLKFLKYILKIQKKGAWCMMWRTRVRSFIKIRAWERCLKSGELKSRKKEKKKEKEKCVLDPKIPFFEQSPNWIQIEFWHADFDIVIRKARTMHKRNLRWLREIKVVYRDLYKSVILWLVYIATRLSLRLFAKSEGRRPLSRSLD